ncbi:MAG: excinuclease ABC subunit UvrA [Aggregatilineales bacterium]
MQDVISIRGAREHNLKNINVDIPRNQLVVITGLSGSGKSSLAFDTIFAEGQRRYVESLSSYARQFLGLMEKPDVDQIEGLSPAVSIDQKSVSHNPRSTVGTVTEVYDYLRLLYARIGIPHCPVCNIVLEAQSAQQIVDKVLGMEVDKRIQILAPIVKNKKGNHEKLLEDIQKEGFVRVRADGEIRYLDEGVELDRYVVHNVEVIVDRLVIRNLETDDEEAAAFETRLTDAIEQALELGDGEIIINDVSDADNPVDTLYSEQMTCPNGHGSYPEPEPRLFSFNTPSGACPTCQGLGFSLQVDPAVIVPDADLSILEGAIDANGWKVDDETSWTMSMFRAISKAYNVPLDAPWRDLTKKQQKLLLYGTKGKKIEVKYQNSRGRVNVYRSAFEGVITNLERRYEQTDSDGQRDRIEGYMSKVACLTCNGQRLRPEAIAVTVNDLSIHEIQLMPISELFDRVLSWRGSEGVASALNDRDRQIADQILNELESRVRFLHDVGLTYLTLARSAASLSGGEAQRIRLATQVGSRLTGVLYVLDEPSIGLHQRDNARLIQTLEGLRDLGNTVLVVEHDEETMRTADWLIDLGPGAGEHGGNVIAAGTPYDVMQVEGSATGDYLSGRFYIETPTERRDGNGLSLKIVGAEVNNLQQLDVEIPLGKLVCVTGVSGSGKSSLVVEVLHKKLAQVINGSRERPGKHKRIEGIEQIDKIINIDQSPIGRTPRSNPGTYTKMFDEIRKLFAALPESKIRGYTAGRFSFNVKGGRCENCGGQGQIKIEMQFLPDIYVDCEVCKGTRYNRETLQVRYKGKNIADVLAMTVSEATEFFTNQPKIVKKLDTLMAVGLGYIRIGQPATTLSGGEAQRIKLSRELSKRATGQTLYILDEPSTGLHAVDVKRLIDVIQQLVDTGNSIVVIEHNLDIIKVSDHIIDLGPEGGSGGGEIIATGTPEDVARVTGSYTGKFLQPYVMQPEPAAD